MELVGEMKSPEMVPVRRQLLGGGSKVTIHSLNTKTKRYIHVTQCKDGVSARTALRDYKVIEQIVETVGGGVRSPEGLDVGALWFMGNDWRKQIVTNLPHALQERVLL
jgi:hypothetical protein